MAAECECGCSGATKGGRFLPGHDAKLKSRLLREATGDDPAAAEVAQQALAQLGWTKFLDKRRQVLADEGARQPRQSRKTRKGGNYLYAMKAAQRVLRWCGQYSHDCPGRIEIGADNVVDIALLRHPDLCVPEGEPPEFSAQELAALESLKPR